MPSLQWKMKYDLEKERLLASQPAIAREIVCRSHTPRPSGESAKKIDVHADLYTYALKAYVGLHRSLATTHNVAMAYLVYEAAAKWQTEITAAKSEASKSSGVYVCACSVAVDPLSGRRPQRSDRPTHWLAGLPTDRTTEVRIVLFSIVRPNCLAAYLRRRSHHPGSLWCGRSVGCE